MSSTSLTGARAPRRRIAGLLALTLLASSVALGGASPGPVGGEEPTASARAKSPAESPRVARDTVSAAPIVDSITNPLPSLGLTADQTAQIEALGQRTIAVQHAILERQPLGSRLTRADRDALLRASLAHNEALRALLTDTQRAAFDAHLSAVAAFQRRRATHSSSAAGAGAR